jgi:hypothetical protein
MLKINQSSHKMLNFSSLLLTALGILLIAPISQAQDSLVNVKKTEIIRQNEQQGEVTLRVKVTGDEKKPIMGLEKEDFELIVVDTNTKKIVSPFDPDKGYSDIPFKFKTPQEATPPPAYILVLLDMSGSMKCSTDLNSKEPCNNNIPKGKRKLDVAVSALQTFIDDAQKRQEKRGGDTSVAIKVAIIPFGFNGEYQPIRKVDELDKFYNVSDAKVKNALNNLALKTLRDATNIYHSLEKSVEFLTSTGEKRFYPVDDKGNVIEPKPRLAVILLTDGFDTDPDYKNNRQKQSETLNTLKQKLRDNDQLTIHTLGYGLTPNALRKKYAGQTISQADYEQEYLDVDGLKRISQVTPNGIFAISGKEDDISKALTTFLDSILGEYEITYQHPNPQRARVYQVSTVADKVASQPEEYRVTVFGRTVSFPTYLGSVGLIAMLAGCWFIPYTLWKKKLQEEN